MSTSVVEESHRSHGKSYLTAVRGQPRARRAADVTTVVVGLAFIGWGLAIVGSLDPLQQALSQFAAALPQWAVALLAFGYSVWLPLRRILLGRSDDWVGRSSSS